MRGFARRGRARTIAVLTTGLVLAGAMATLAHGELTSKGNLFVTFTGGIEPIALPRHERAPITVWMDGKVRTLKGADPPSLDSITLALNRAGHLETKGLPKCRKGELIAASREQAMEECGDALVGTGTYRARSTFPEQTRSPTHGRITAFNRQLFFPVLPVSIHDFNRDGRADGFAMPHAGEDVDLVGFNLHSPAASIALLPAPKLTVHEIKVNWDAGWKS